MVFVGPITYRDHAVTPYCFPIPFPRGKTRRGGVLKDLVGPGRRIQVPGRPRCSWEGIERVRLTYVPPNCISLQSSPFVGLPGEGPVACSLLRVTGAFNPWLSNAVLSLCWGHVQIGRTLVDARDSQSHAASPLYLAIPHACKMTLKGAPFMFLRGRAGRTASLRIKCRWCAYSARHLADN